jgi:hypothetical protein
MFDANYFRSALSREIEAAGGSPVVEVALVNGHVHRLRALLDVADGYVILSTHPAKGDLSHERPRFGAEATEESLRVAVSYDSIAAVIVDAAPEKVRTRPGFSS